MPDPGPFSRLRSRFPALAGLDAGGRRARRVPFVQQMEAADCGAACLSMVLGYHGRHVPLKETREATGSAAFLATFTSPPAEVEAVSPLGPVATLSVEYARVAQDDPANSVGGRGFQKLGLVRPYPTEDRGRAEVTGKATDEFVFKVPSLRNVEKTGPWFHDGAVDTLDTAVRLMAHHQLGKTLTGEEVASIVAFLNALTGEVPAAYVAEPKLPSSGPYTPSPDPS